VVLRGGGVSDKGMMDSVIRDCGGGQGERGGAERRQDSRSISLVHHEVTFYF
jgi:hypothetical protein